MVPPSLVVFGPQTPHPTTDQLVRLRSTLLNNEHLESFAAAIEDLGSFWETLVNADSDLAQIPGVDLLHTFNVWVEQGVFPTGSSMPLPNTILTPLTLIIHIIEYFDSLGDDALRCSHAQVLKHVTDAGVQGFCSGLLAAVAVACSSDEDNLVRLACVSLRLAVVIGAYVDLDGAFGEGDKETACVAVRWAKPEHEQSILDILKGFPLAYISVVSSADTVTVTVDSGSVSGLKQSLTAAGASVTTIPLGGRFHHSDHTKAVDKTQALLSSVPGLRYLPGSRPLVLVRGGSGTAIGIDASLEECVVRSMMLNVFDWHVTITQSIACISNRAPGGKAQVLSLGLTDCVPRTLAAEHGLEVHNLLAVKAAKSGHAGSEDTPDGALPDDAIAIVGMACRFPGADDLEEFWNVLQSGSTMLGTLPKDRFTTTGLRRSPDNDMVFRGNFLREGFAFDHRFFGKSSREAASMDPQHKLVLQVAYETLESAGYFNKENRPVDVGVYVGVAASDYEDNVASHPANAFSVLGMVRAFNSGKISHFFGFSGPSLVFDTACSSSAVAIHTASRAIQKGDCSMALAGGVNVITSPILHQNLAAANFLSPTGASKAFDARADGYCRGEGSGLVLLKKYSAAVADSDRILGVLAGSGVNQNDHSAPITVPVSGSQSDLYRTVLESSGLDAKEVSFVEAHGTGTPKGDPIECASIRLVFGSQPDRKLHFGSVKGNIGHTEAASGVAGLIKTLLMMERRLIPPQASFQSLNPNIPPLEAANMEISRSLKPWNVKRMVAFVNNYGAAGSNAALAVTQAPKSDSGKHYAETIAQKRVTPTYPVMVTAKSATSLQAYARALKTFLDHHRDADQSKLLADVTYSLAYKKARDMPFSFKAKIKSIPELRQQLESCMSQPLSARSALLRARPIVLVFCGQTGNTVNLSEDAFNALPVLQKHLSQCDSILMTKGLNSIFPTIFQREPILDVVDLNTALFSVQYSMAMSWIDSGLKVETMVGHSFGELTALAVAGYISLEDAIHLIAGRARLMKEKWPPERGAMLAVDAIKPRVDELISLTQQKHEGAYLEIACYNGPSSHVVVGSKAAIQALEETISTNSPSVKAKALNVTHGFHSAFVDSIMKEYAKIVDQVVVRKPKISLQLCSSSEQDGWRHIGYQRIASQSRRPVFFRDTVSRIEERYGACTWIEAGSGTAAMALTRRALQDSSADGHSFHSVKFGEIDALGSLADLTLGLWDAGVKFQYWPFASPPQEARFKLMTLPPYQFEKHTHRLEYIDSHKSAKTKLVEVPVSSQKPTLVSFAKLLGPDHHTALFNVDQSVEDFVVLIEGHSVLGNPLCPVSLYVEIATRAAKLIAVDFDPVKHAPQMENLVVSAPLGRDLNRKINATLERLGSEKNAWRFRVTSSARDAAGATSHATAVIRLCSVRNVALEPRFKQIQRLINYDRVNGILTDPAAAGVQGSMVYKMFDRVVNYSEIYRGVVRIASKGNEVSGIVSMPASESSALKETSCDPLAIDNFTQVAGLHVNGLDDCNEDEVYICSTVEELQDMRDMSEKVPSRGPWLVFSTCSGNSGKELSNDIYVFEPESKTIVVMILGVKFHKTNVNALKRVLSRANASGTVENIKSTLSVVEEQAANAIWRPHPTVQKQRLAEAYVKPKSVAGIQSEVAKLLHDVADAPIEDITDTTRLEDIGIDSLMATELLGAIRKKFNINLSAREFEDIVDFKSLCEALDSSDASFSEDDSVSEKFETRATTPSSGYEGEMLQNDMTPKLAALVKEHLEYDGELLPDTKLGDAGLDSLMGIELSNDIQKQFGKQVDVMKLDSDTTFGQLSELVIPSSRNITAQSVSEKLLRVKFQNDASNAQTPVEEMQRQLGHEEPTERASGPQDMALDGVDGDFRAIRSDYARFAEETGWAGFRTNVYPKQRQLVLAYVLEAFSELGCDVVSLNVGDPVPSVPHLPKHDKVIAQYFAVLRDASLVALKGDGFVRTNVAAPQTKASQLLEQMLVAFPQHASELKLLESTGSKLAQVLSGSIDPLNIIFRTKADRYLLENVYTNSPMFATGTKVMGNFLRQALGCRRKGKLRILELGAGTGGTTKHMVDVLTSLGVDFSYTFTDLSSSLVAAAKRKFSKYPGMDYMVLDIEKNPLEDLVGKHHLIVSSNCVHATKSLLVSLTNARKMLRSDGIICLLELTRNLFWLDCVFGLLEGWWLFEDGRQHVLASEHLWKQTLMQAGFKHVDWSDDASEESNQYRVVVGFASASSQNAGSTALTRETVEFQRIGSTVLEADIYYPRQPDDGERRRPIAIMIHGGGHIMLSRKDIRPKQTRVLLERGFLPVSIDYRLCPEVTLTEGPMADVCTALGWARNVLPKLSLARPDIRPNGNKVAVVGWSTGGTLSLTLGWTARQRDIAPPDAALAFYCPTDYESNFWKMPNYPENTTAADAAIDYDLLEGVQDRPLTAYKVPREQGAVAGWMTLKDPRSRIALHMNWNGQALPTLLDGLPSGSTVSAAEAKRYLSRPQPSLERIREVSPFAQAVLGSYKTPTFFVHGTMDDLVPCDHTEKISAALAARDVPTGTAIVEGAHHYFDLYPESEEKYRDAVVRGYDFLCAQLEMN
ncbi:hypothetical protein K458DRAFT_397816 [Lentithecium fluviatile CBS 122367]|uniref:Polyketide synthase n=1 Tax=Lentithecium fluviatile CBS 122367 TaxID=1168545 RepID=A0A6G1IBK8_9PLEO|nr:hypothetical protein K458DRAFT_397816 [Lentithecium fluviatile CBS 122367]